MSDRFEIGTRTGRPRKHGAAIDIDTMIGRRFGQLVVLGRSNYVDKQRKVHVDVRCDCGVEKPVGASTLLNNNAVNAYCGTDDHRSRDRERVGTEWVGKQFGLLTVVGALRDGAENGCALVTVRCECGLERRVRLDHVKRGHIRSCGGDAHRDLKPPKRWRNAPESDRKTYAVRVVGFDSAIKIGSALNVEERLRDFQLACPAEVVAFAICETNIEKEVHRLLDKHRLHGEWFSTTEEVKSIIATRFAPAHISVYEESLDHRPTRVKSGPTRCKVCGEVGHYAKTCRKQFEAA